ncbi:MAG: hypothetical protein K9K86_06315 [Pseudomonadales bacterium]|nr:hypothetical protein [Pseudomonadales bacterium]
MYRTSLFNQSITPVLWVVLGFAFVSLSGCASLGYEKALFATDYVRVVHSERHCKDVEQSTGAEVPNADLVLSRVDGLGYFVATKTAWEVRARQLAAELDADISLVRPCGREGGLQYAQIQVWRSRGFSPIVQEETPPREGTLSAPSRATYGARLQNIFACLERSRAVVTLISAKNKVRLGKVDATEFFSSDAYFPGYAKIDRYFQPTRADTLTLSMILSDRYRADWEAERYLALSPKSRSLHAEQYLICLLDHGYRW